MRKLFLYLIISFLFFGHAKPAYAQSSSFIYTGSVQAYTVAPGLTVLTVDVRGAHGGNNLYFLLDTNRGGYGGRVVCTLAVTPGQVLNVYVGGTGVNGYSSSIATGGYNGGGNSNYYAGSGGGASDIRLGGTALSNRVVVAGGGGGAGAYGSTSVINGDRGGGWRRYGGRAWVCLGRDILGYRH